MPKLAKRRKLTKRLIESVRLKPGQRERLLWDSEVPRLAVRVRRGGAPRYVLRMRLDGRQRWYQIGPHGDPWTIETAREEARRQLGEGATVVKLRETGRAPSNLLHPVEARDRDRGAPTVAEFAERYLADHAEPHKAPGTVDADRGLFGLRPPRSTASDAKRNVRTILRDPIAQIRVDRVTRADVVKLHLAWKSTPTRANRALALLSHMFTMAEKWGIRPDGANPCRHVPRFKETKRERFLSAAELGSLGKALASLEAEERYSPFALAAVRLLIFTGARASEVLGLTWALVDAANGLVRLKRKGGIGTLYLPPPALEVLSKLPRVDGCPFVIAGSRQGRALSLAGLEQVWQVVRERAGLEDVRLHDLRHSFASVAVAGGASLPLIGGLLGHTQPSTTARYAHLSADPLRAAAGATAETIAAAMKVKPKKRRGSVTPLRRRR